jgi:hypothetical protein
MRALRQKHGAGRAHFAKVSTHAVQTEISRLPAKLQNNIISPDQTAKAADAAQYEIA